MRQLQRKSSRLGFVPALRSPEELCPGLSWVAERRSGILNDFAERDTGLEARSPNGMGPLFCKQIVRSSLLAKRHRKWTPLDMRGHSTVRQ